MRINHDFWGVPGVPWLTYLKRYALDTYKAQGKTLGVQAQHHRHSMGTDWSVGRVLERKPYPIVTAWTWCSVRPECQWSCCSVGDDILIYGKVWECLILGRYHDMFNTTRYRGYGPYGRRQHWTVCGFRLNGGSWLRKASITGGWFGTWFLWLSIQLGMSSSQLTNSIIFQRGRAQPPTR
jgi:hypothetical protein